MTILLADVPLAAIAIDETRFPDREQKLVPAHLLRYFEKFDPLPAIVLAIEDERAIIVRGHKYLAAARALGRPTIRAVINSPSTRDEVRAFLGRPDVAVLDREEIRTKEAEQPNPSGWHVFFFKRILSDGEKLQFDDLVRSLFHGSIRIIHDDTGPVAEFEAATPVTDEAWASTSLASFSSFSQDVVTIVSYQGRRFGFR